MSLCKPNREPIAKLNMAYGITQTVRFGQVNDLSFSIPYEVVRDSQLVRNHVVDLVREKFLIKVVVGSIEEWYIIIKKTKSMGDTDSIRLECYSLPYELKYKKLVDYKATSYNCFQVLTEGLENSNWKVGYVNPEFYMKWRSFDESSTTVLDFVFRICETYNGVPTFDTINRTVSIWKEEEISTYKGFWISYGKYLQMVEDTVSVDEIITRLIVTANENASINTVNPTGKSYIDDFSYFLYPFERDNNRNVLSSSYFMGDDLCHALLDYNQLLNQNETTFSDLLNVRKSLESEMTELSTDLLTLNTDFQSILDNIEVAKKQGNDLTELNKQRDAKQVQVDSKQSEINNQQKMLDDNSDEIKALNDLLSMENNFSAELLEELTDYIQVEEWADDNQTSDEDYFYAASDHMKTVSIPPINLNLNIINFFDVVEEQHNWNRMGIGDIIRVKQKKLGIDAKTKITEITFNYDEGSIGVTISNTKRPENIQEKLKNAFYKINKLNVDYNKRKRNWEVVATNFNTRNDRIKATPNIPKDMNLSHKLNDNGSVDLTISWAYDNYETTQKDADNIDGFLIHLYSSGTNENYVFGSKIAEETVIAVSSDKLTYTFPSIPSNRYFTLGLKAYRNVDDDINKEGVLFSKIVTSLPYLPSDSVIINGNLKGSVTGDLTGRLNGVHHTVSDTEPPNPELNDTWLDINTNQQKRYDGTTFKPISAGDATTISGLVPDVNTTPQSIPVRDENGVIQGSITGDAKTLNGKTDASFATLDGTGNIPLTQLSNVTSTIPIIKVGTYIGDGTASKEINIGFTPKLAKVYTTNSTDVSVFIPSTTGGFIIKNNATNYFIEGDGVNKDIPFAKYGKLSTNGFFTGDSVEAYLNKLNVIYYWEAF
jgi:phage minor structural protein